MRLFHRKDAPETYISPRPACTIAGWGMLKPDVQFLISECTQLEQPRPSAVTSLAVLGVSLV